MTGPIPTGRIPTGPIPTGPIPTGPIPTGPIPTGHASVDDARWDLDLGDGLVVAGTERPDSPVLTRFFAGYDKAFTLPDEREELPGFQACLALNPASRNRFGRTHRELVIIVSDGPHGTLLGGANFLATAMPPVPGHPPVAVALNYLFIEQAARGRGLSRRLLAAVARLANRAVDQADESQWPAMFIEQNDPLLMSAQAYAADTATSGTDQVERLRIWERLGARLVDFAYVQPALSDRQHADDGLAYAVVGFPLPTIAARYLHDHLESFFGVSVLKGGDPARDTAAAAQLRTLRDMTTRGETVALLSTALALDRLHDRADWRPGIPLRRFVRESITG